MEETLEKPTEKQKNEVKTKKKLAETFFVKRQKVYVGKAYGWVKE